jgi:hypothetical protein
MAVKAINGKIRVLGRALARESAESSRDNSPRSSVSSQRRIEKRHPLQTYQPLSPQRWFSLCGASMFDDQIDVFAHILFVRI